MSSIRTVYLRELVPDDAPAIGRLEAAVHPRALADGAEGHRRYLEAACAEGVNLSFGAFDGGKLVGYVLCYGFEPTVAPGEQGDALYVEDLVVLPSYRSMLPRLFKRLTGEARNHFPGAPIEGHAVTTIFRIWQRHASFFERLGFAMRSWETAESFEGETRYVIRWDPTESPAVVPAGALDRLLAKLTGETLEVGGAAYTFKLVRDPDDWATLEPLWDRLLLATSDHTVFQSFAYQRLWWRHFAGDRELCIVLVLRNGTVEGIAPLQVETVRRFGRYCRELGFIGSRWQVDRPTFLFPAPAAAGLRQALVHWLVRRADLWDYAAFYEQRIDAEGFRELQDAFRAAGCLVATTPDSVCPYLDLDGDWPGFLAAKSSTFRKNLKTAARRLAEGGTVDYRRYDAPAEVLQQLEIYRDIEARSWKSQAGVGVSRDDDYFAFHRELAAVFARDRAFVIRMLTVGGRAVAGTFGLEYDGVFSSLQIAHDHAYARCSPGTYLEAREMEECFGRGLREYEFLGGFLNNKSRWTSTFRHTAQLYVYRRTPRFTTAYLFSHRLKPWLKERIRPYMKSWSQSVPAPEPGPDAGSAGRTESS